VPANVVGNAAHFLSHPVQRHRAKQVSQNRYAARLLLSDAKNAMLQAQSRQTITDMFGPALLGPKPTSEPTYRGEQLITADLQ
jgi:hypothetical protein